MRRSLPVGLALLLGLGSACSGRKAEEAARRAESERQAAALGQALVKFTSSLSPAKAREDFKLARPKVPARHQAALAKVEACRADGVEQVQKAAEHKGYATIATVAVGCIVSMEDLVVQLRRALIVAILDEKGSSGERDQDAALLDLEKGTLASYHELMVLLVDLGPEEARTAAFDAAAAELAKRVAAGGKQETLASVLQRAHEGEKTAESKARMAARLKELAVPLEAVSPVPAAAGTGS